MSMRWLTSAIDMAEFVYDPVSKTRRNATCQELALLGALHSVRPYLWPMNGLTLGNITRAMIAAGEAASPGGASTPHEGQWYLSMKGYPSRFLPPSSLEQSLVAYGGLMPLILEYADAEQLPGDEKNVHYHYNTVVGYDPFTQRVLTVDGDNWAVRQSADGSGPLVTYHLSDLRRAQVVSILLLEVTPVIDPKMPAVAAYFTDDGTVWHCKQTGMLLGGAIRDFYRTISAPLAGITQLGLPKTNEMNVPGTKNPARMQEFERGVLVWDPKREVDNPAGNTQDVYFMKVSSGEGQKLVASGAA